MRTTGDRLRAAGLLAAAFALVGLVAVATVARGQEPGMKASTVAASPAWQTLKSLVGEWEGTLEVNGKMETGHVEMRLTGDGSAIMHIMDKGSLHEMVTMFHPDGTRLLATHYCAAHNQPRMALVTSTPNRLTFEFVDGTNIAPGDTHMKRLVLTIKDASHHDEAWTSQTGGKESPADVFSYTRKK
jgi:hypothetical protein